ncbi:cilia- and flagella-associated protein 157 [Bombina bombina]|uniref:cilia- and flagella-associated protein 157 n=1 Tax=Bombina bombina TaxID=8345 RepID=UPI00235ADC66|nr:cilia- and flagella-associated protein 157 [Bombina bombina]
MAPKKKRDKSGANKKRPEAARTVIPESVSEQSKESYLLQIRDLESRLERYQQKLDDVCSKESLNHAEYEQLASDKKEIVSFLKRTLNQRTDEIADLNDQLLGLQQAKESEKDAYETQLAQMRREFQETKDQLTAENMLLAGKLASLEEFRVQKEELMAKFAAVEETLRIQEEENKERIYTLEKKAVLDKDRLKKEMVQRVNAVAAEFRRVSSNQMAETTKRTIRENVSISSQLTKMSDKTMELIVENDDLKEKVAEQRKQIEMLEDTEQELAKKNLSNQKVIRMLTDKCQQQQNILDLSLLSEQQLNQQQEEYHHLQAEVLAFQQHVSSLEEEVQSLKQETDGLRGELNEGNKLKESIKLVLSQAATSLKDVLMEAPQQEEPEDTFCTRRYDMLQNLLLLLNSAATLDLGPPLYDFYTKGTHFIEHKMDSTDNRLTLSPVQKRMGVSSHYRMGDLGLVPRQDISSAVLSKMSMLSRTTRLGPVGGNPSIPKDLLTVSYEEKWLKQTALPGIPSNPSNKPILMAK